MEESPPNAWQRQYETNSFLSLCSKLHVNSCISLVIDLTRSVDEHTRAVNRKLNQAHVCPETNEQPSWVCPITITDNCRGLLWEATKPKWSRVSKKTAYALHWWYRRMRPPAWNRSKVTLLQGAGKDPESHWVNQRRNGTRESHKDSWMEVWNARFRCNDGLTACI